jgi:Xaa-Pro aminopeptidase
MRAIDLPRLRSERLNRLQAAMRKRDVAACLLTQPANVRYATGTAIMTVYGLGYFFRCALVFPDGQPILFEHPNSMHLTKGVLEDVRPMIWDWEFSGLDAMPWAQEWANEIRDALRERGVEDEPIALDRLTTPGFLGLQKAGLELIDAGPALLDARMVKTPEEVHAFRVNGPIIEEMLGNMKAAIAPGVRENELLATLTDTLLRRGGEFQITRGVEVGPNTNPWRTEATDLAVEDGDLVWVDTDANGIEGYFFCVSRTFLCGDGKPNPQQQDAYRAAYDYVSQASELLKPGTSFWEFAEKAPRFAEKYIPQRYEVLGHSVGLEDEGPSFPYPDDDPPSVDYVLEENMVMVLEGYFGEVGARDGVKLGDQFLITKDGPELLVNYPYEERLLS